MKGIHQKYEVRDACGSKVKSFESGSGEIHNNLAGEWRQDSGNVFKRTKRSHISPSMAISLARPHSRDR